ncbi:MAG: hypothetical protein SGARI_000429, partial [Bacillariaceae sp.]
MADLPPPAAAGNSATTRANYRLDPVICKKEIRKNSKLLVDQVYSANIQRCYYILLHMDRGWAVPADLKTECNNGTALPLQAEYHQAAWGKFEHAKRTRNRLGRGPRVYVARTPSALDENANTTAAPVVRCNFITWAKTKMFPHETGATAGAAPMRGLKYVMPKVCGSMNAALNAATKYASVVRMYAAEARIFHPPAYDVMHPTLALQPRSDVNATETPEQKALTIYHDRKKAQFKAEPSDDPEGAPPRLPPGWRFHPKAGPPGVPGPDDEVSPEPDWGRVARKIMTAV